jgi:predicted DNA-binding transcriptional regulator AlpA
MAPTPPFNTELVNVLWVRALLNCSNMTIHRHIVDGTLPPPFKVGRERLWVKSELIAHIVKVGKVAGDE